MKLIKQRTDDDCTIAAMAMITGKEYETLVKDVSNEWTPGTGVGTSVTSVSVAAQYDFSWSKGLTDVRPCLVSVTSLNLLGKKHLAAIDENNVVLDPSSGKQVNFNHCAKTASYSYFNFHHES